MKKINNKLAIALLRGVVTLNGFMVTMCVALFMESLNSFVVALLVGALIIVLVDETITNK